MRAWPGLIACLLALAVAAPAHAGGTLFHGGVSELRGPVFAGDRLAWATQSETGGELHLAAPDGSGSTARAFALPRGFRDDAVFGLEASADRLAVGYGVPHCETQCRDGEFGVIRGATLSAPLEQQLARLEPSCAPKPGVGPRFAVSGNVVAYRDECDGRTIVKDFDTGQSFVFPPASVIRVGGPYLATLESRTVVLREWRTGAVRARVDGADYPVDVQDDGKVAFRRGALVSDGDYAWVSPEQPEPRTITRMNHIGLRIAGDRVAFLTSSGGLEVLDLEGGLVAASPHARLHDFDGRRVAWADSPCAVVGIVTWDLQGEPLRMPEGGCPAPTPRSRVLKADLARDRVQVKVTCPADSPLGCRGYMRLVIPESYRGLDERPLEIARGGWTLDPAYWLLPGQQRTVELKLSSRGICTARTKALRPVLDVWTQGRNDLGNLRSSWRVRVPRLAPAVARCKRRARGA